MIIRSATAADLPGIMAVETDAFIPAIREQEDLFAERIRVCKNCFLVFNDVNTRQITGYLSAERWNLIPETDDLFMPGHSAGLAHSEKGSVLYISSFALLSSYRGSGLGSELFYRSIEYLRSHITGIRTWLLCVNSAWNNARHIYQNTGFTEFRTIPLFFPADNYLPATDGIIMIREAAT